MTVETLTLAVLALILATQLDISRRLGAIEKQVEVLWDYFKGEMKNATNNDHRTRNYRLSDFQAHRVNGGIERE